MAGMKVCHRLAFSDKNAALAYGKAASKRSGQSLVLTLLFGGLGIALIFAGGFFTSWLINRKKEDSPEPDMTNLDMLRDMFSANALFERSYIVRECIIHILSFLSPSEIGKAVKALSEIKKGDEIDVPRTMLTSCSTALKWIRQTLEIEIDEEAYHRRWEAGLDRVRDSSRVSEEAPSTDERALEKQSQAQESLEELVKTVKEMQENPVGVSEIVKDLVNAVPEVMAQIKEMVASGEIQIPETAEVGAGPSLKDSPAKPKTSPKKSAGSAKKGGGRGRKKRSKSK